MAKIFRPGVKFVKDGTVGKIIVEKEKGVYVVNWYDKRNSTSYENSATLRGAQIIKGEI